MAEPTAGASDEARAALHRLKRRVGRERGRYERIYNAKVERTGHHDDRSYGEANVCAIVQSFIDDELKKLAAPPRLPDRGGF